MSFNLNEDLFDKKSKRVGGGMQPPNEYNSQLNFAEMPAGQSMPSSYFDANGYAATTGYGATPNMAGQPYYSDWSSQAQFYNPMQTQDKMDPFVPSPKLSEYGPVDFENEPPLLEELGINFEHIFRKTKCVLNPFAKPHESIMHDEDLAGPLVFCIAYGFSLLLMGKIQFGYIYGITALGCLCMYALLNLMSERDVSAVCIGSTLGYCLLPMVILSFLSSFITLNGLVGLILTVFFILWCSISSSKLFVTNLNMSNQQLLVLYPCFLMYGIFGLLNVF